MTEFVPCDLGFGFSVYLLPPLRKFYLQPFFDGGGTRKRQQPFDRALTKFCLTTAVNKPIILPFVAQPGFGDQEKLVPENSTVSAQTSNLFRPNCNSIVA